MEYPKIKVVGKEDQKQLNDIDVDEDRMMEVTGQFVYNKNRWKDIVCFGEN